MTAQPGTAFDTAAMVAELTFDEGMRLKAYDDATGVEIKPGYVMVGYPTIGAGRCLQTKGISPAEANTFLSNDIAEYLEELDNLDWFAPLDPVRKRAIVNMRHQLGLAGLLGFSVMIGYVLLGKFDLAQNAGKNSTWFRQTPARAARVLRQLRDGTAGAYAGV